MTKGLPAEAGICPLHQQPIQRECRRCGDFGCAVCFEAGGPLCSRCCARAGGRVELGSCIGRWFNDPNLGANIAIGAICFLFAFAFFPMLLVMGYQLRVARRTREDPGAPLPTWEDPGALFLDGLKAWLATVIPVLLAYFVLGLVVGGGMLVVALLAGSGGGGPVAAVAGMVGMVGLVGVLFAFCFLWIYLQPALHLHYLRTGSIGAGLELGAIRRLMFARPGRYFEVFLYHLVIGMIAGFVGELACLIGLLATMPWAFFTQGHLLGLFWREVDQNEEVYGASS